MEVVPSDAHNCWSTVADFPRYGSGLWGWRDTLIEATTTRAKLKEKELLLRYAREKVPVSELQGELPDPLKAGVGDSPHSGDIFQ